MYIVFFVRGVSVPSPNCTTAGVLLRADKLITGGQWFLFSAECIEDGFEITNPCFCSVQVYTILINSYNPVR